MAKFKEGDHVIVTVDAPFLNNVDIEYPYRKGYMFSIGYVFDNVESQHGNGYCEKGDRMYATYDKYLDYSPIHLSPLKKTLEE